MNILSTEITVTKLSTKPDKEKRKIRFACIQPFRRRKTNIISEFTSEKSITLFRDHCTNATVY